jgi:hypothetical protein
VRAEIASEAVDAAFEEFGSAAVYTPPSGPAVDGITIIRGRPDAEASLGDSRVRVDSVVIEVRASEASPARDGTFAIDEETFTVIAAPKRNDPERLIWRCECRQST